jgi:hypothetical protein
MTKFYVAALALLVVTTADAQNYGFDVFFRGGVGLPDAPTVFSQNWRTGPHFTSGFEFTLSRQFSVGVLGEYTRSSINKTHLAPEDLAATDAQLSRSAMDIFSTAFYINYRIAGRVKGTFPFLYADAGLTHLKSGTQTFLLNGANTTIPGSSETAFRSAWGGGIDVPLSANICFTVTGMYVYVFSEVERTGYVPIDMGFKMVF